MTGQAAGSPVDRGTAVIFMHIGKTAGSTLGRILRRHYPADRVFAFGVPPGAREIPVDVEWNGRIVRRMRPPREQNLDVFARLPEAERARFRLIYGHTVFGLHEHVPNPCAYLTMLRHPVALVSSQYRHVRRRTAHFHHDQVVRQGLSLEDYVSSGISLEMDNSQTRAVSGDLDTPIGECGPAMLEAAKRNLDTWFPVVGISERFDESLIAMRRAYGWRRLHYVPANTSPKSERRAPLPTETVRLIEDHNALDMELYRYGCERLDHVLAEGDAERDLARFQRSNALYRPLGTLTYTVPKAIQARLIASRAR